jgi:acyl carrier protein
LVVGHVQHELAAVLGLDETVSYDTGFFDLGMDSLTAMDFKTRLEKTLELPLPSTLAFDYSTLETLVDYLAAEHLRSGAPAEDAPKELVAASVWEVPNAGESRPRVDIDQISEDEAEHLLMEKLAELGRRGR